MLQRMSVVLLEFYKNLLVLLYFRCFTIVLTAGPNIETRLLNSVFAANRRSGLSSGALWHRKSSQVSPARVSQAQRDYDTDQENSRPVIQALDWNIL